MIEKWTPEHMHDLIQEQMAAGNITQDDVLAALGDYRPLKVVSRGDIAELVQSGLKEKGLPIHLLADVTDDVMDNLDGNLDPDHICWNAIEAMIDEIIHNTQHWNKPKKGRKE